MPNSPPPHPRTFTPETQESFCRLSGDFNPMHSDPAAARRTIAGGIVVHGLHQALIAIETATAHRLDSGLPASTITAIDALFTTPVLLGETAHFHLTTPDPHTSHILAIVRDQTVSKFTLRWAPHPPPAQPAPPPLPPDPILDLPFHQLPGRAGVIPLGLDQPLAERLFPLATTTLGPLAIAELLALSRLVGAHCPGLNSVFNQFTIDLRDDPSAPPAINFQVIKTDDRFGKVTIQVTGPRASGRVIAFFRPPPEPQPAMREVASLISPGAFARSVALIVGGSRGLGEVTARLIAAGGPAPPPSSTSSTPPASPSPSPSATSPSTPSPSKPAKTSATSTTATQTPSRSSSTASPAPAQTRPAPSFPSPPRTPST